MSDEETLSPAAFGRTFRDFLEQSVKGREAEDPPFVARLADHLGADPRELPILAEAFSVIEHPNVQAALDAWMEVDGRAADLVGMSAEQKRYQGLGFSDLITPASSGLMGDRAPRPGPVDYVNVAVGYERVRACVQHGLYLLRDGERSLAALVRGPPSTTARCPRSSSRSWPQSRRRRLLSSPRSAPACSSTTSTAASCSPSATRTAPSGRADRWSSFWLYPRSGRRRWSYRKVC